MQEQVKEMKKATNLDWRPFLHIMPDSVICSFQYSLLDEDSNKTVTRTFDEIAINSDSYRAVKEILIWSTFTAHLRNIGATPLLIKRMLLCKQEFRDVCLIAKVCSNRSDDCRSRFSDVLI